MRYRLLICSLLMTGVSHWSMADDTSSKEAVRTEKTHAGVILEYSQESATRPDQEDVTGAGGAAPPAAGGTAVELIVGGQAEDGVAKRMEIPVRK